jgi:CelD/BcsL family acetyltransferase involved in cellulose biosynthesis
LWPLCRTRLGPLSIARFLGGKHSNANFPLWRPEVASGVTGAHIRAELDDVARSEPSVDMLVLLNQLKSLSSGKPAGTPDARRVTRQICHSTLPSDFEAFYRERVSSSTRRKMRQKGRALAKHGAVSYCRVRTKEDCSGAGAIGYFGGRRRRRKARLQTLLNRDARGKARRISPPSLR